MNQTFRALNRTSILASLCVLTAIATTGCEQFAASLDKNYEEREKAKAYFAELDKQCPKRINEYTTLKSVTYLLNAVEYRYVVSESGRGKVLLPNTWLIKREVLKDIKDTPAASAVTKLNMEMMHVYKDSDDVQMLSFDVTKKDLRTFKPRPDDELDVKTVGLSSGDSVVGIDAELKNLKHRPTRAQAKAWFATLNKECPKKINDYTTLQYVKFTGTNRVEYRYQVQPEGITKVNLDFRKEMQRATAEETKASRYGDAIFALDLSAMHVYKSLQDTQMLSYMITRNELRKVGKTSESTVQPSAPEANDGDSPFVDIFAASDTDPSDQTTVADQPVSKPKPAKKSRTKWPEPKKSYQLPATPDAGVKINPYFQ